MNTKTKNKKVVNFFWSMLDFMAQQKYILLNLR